MALELMKEGLERGGRELGQIRGGEKRRNEVEVREEKGREGGRLI